MATNVQVGDQVYVPVAKMPGLPDLGKAFFRGTVTERTHRSVQVGIPNGFNSEPISTRYVHRTIGVCIFVIGDYDTEATLLDPLGKSVLQNCRIIFGDDDFVRFWKIRSLDELRDVWARGTPRAFDQIIIIGHGVGASAIRFGKTDCSAIQIAAALGPANGRQWKFILSCCELGRAQFAKAFSAAAAVEHAIAPFHSVHGAVAAQFIQTYLVRNLITAETPKVAFKNAAYSVPGNAAFRFWDDGALSIGH